MKWEIKPFNLLDYTTTNKSSRRIGTTAAQGNLTLIGSLDFGEMIVGIPSSVWVTFSNEGTKQLKINNFIIPSTMTYYGSVPSVLDSGNSFKLRITLTLKNIGSYSTRIAFKIGRVLQYFNCVANVNYNVLLYNNFTEHSGIYFYSGYAGYSGLPVSVMNYNGSSLYNGVVDYA